MAISPPSSRGNPLSFTGWTGNAEDPEDIDAHGGSLAGLGDALIGDTSDDAAEVTNSPAVILYESGDVAARFGYDGGDLYLLLGKDDSTRVKVTTEDVTVINAADEGGAYLDFDGLHRFTSLEVANPDEVPASPTVQDVVDALVALDLITQAT